MKVSLRYPKNRTRPWGRPSPPPPTWPTLRTAHQCCTQFTTVKCVQKDHWKFRWDGWPCKGSWLLQNCCNEVHQTPLPWGRRMAGTAPRITINVSEKPRDLLRPYWPAVRLSNHSSSTKTSGTSPRPPHALGGSGPPPRKALVLPLRLRNSPMTQPPPPSQPQQYNLYTEIKFQTSPHQLGLRSNNLPPRLIVTSHQRPVLVQTTTIWLTSSHNKIHPKIKKTLWIYWPSSTKSEISTRPSP